MHAQSSMEAHVLLDVRENSFERVRGVGNVELWMVEIDKEMWKISLHAVVGAPSSTVRVVPASCDVIRRSFLEKLSPLFMPEFQPERELRLADSWQKLHQRLQVLSCLQLRPSRDVARDDLRLVEVAHLHGHGKALQQATSAVTDDGFHLPSVCFQSLDAILVRRNCFVWEELPEKILRAVGTPPHHDAEESPEVRRVHDDDHLVGCHLLLLNLHVLQLSLHPLRAASELLRDLRMGLLAMRELSPDLCRIFLSLLAALLAARRALPNLSTFVRAVLLERPAIATRTYFS